MTGQPPAGPAEPAKPKRRRRRKQQEDQGANQAFEAALWAETDRSLRREPDRKPWTSTAGKLSAGSRQQ